MTDYSTPELYKRNPSGYIRPGSVVHLITVGLGYCCEFFFWQHYTEVSSDLIAARLGITVRTVNRHRQWYAGGGVNCESKYWCLLKTLKEPSHD